MNCIERCWPPGAKCGWDCYVEDRFNIHLILEEQEKRGKREKSEPPSLPVYFTAALIGWFLGQMVYTLFPEEVTAWLSRVFSLASRLTV